MEILADPITVNCRKVLAGLKMMNVDYTLKKIDYFQGEQKGPEYLAINPNASLPAMRDDGLMARATPTQQTSRRGPTLIDGFSGRAAPGFQAATCIL